MKKHTPKLTLRRRRLAPLRPTRLAEVAGATNRTNCTHCVTADCNANTQDYEPSCPTGCGNYCFAGESHGCHGWDSNNVCGG